MTDMTRANRLLDRLYAAAETLVDSVCDPVIIEEATLRDRAAALGVVERFIDKLEKRAAAAAADEANAASHRQKSASAQRSPLMENVRQLDALSTELDKLLTADRDGSANGRHRAAQRSR